MILTPKKKITTFSNFNEVVNNNIPVDVICVVGHRPGHSDLLDIKQLNTDLWLDRPSDLDGQKCQVLNESFAQNNQKVLFTYVVADEFMFMENTIISV